MSGVALVIPVKKAEFVQLPVLRRVELGHHRTISERGQQWSEVIQFFAGLFEMFEGFRGNDQIIRSILFEIWKEIRIVAFRPVPLALQQGFQDRFVSAAVIENGLDIRAVICNEIDFFLEHVNVAFVIEAVFVFEVAFNFFFWSDEKAGWHKDKPAGGAEVVLALVCFQ